jgi:hypothetical protein
MSINTRNKYRYIKVGMIPKVGTFVKCLKVNNIKCLNNSEYKHEKT